MPGTSIILYSNFAKDRNSTLRPSAAVTSVKLDCIIKEPFTPVSPTLIFNFDGTPTNFTYCQIPEFNRYYFIDGWSYSNGRWFASTTVDVLASNRESILDSTQYVLRSASRYDANLADSYYPAKSEYIYQTYEPASGYWDDTGIYVCTITGASNGETEIYAFTPSQFTNFRGILTTSAEWSDMEKITDEISTELVKMLFNPLDYITSCRWYPFNANRLEDITVNITSVPLGWWSVPASCKRLVVDTYRHSAIFSFNIADHPQKTSRGEWLNLEPYRKLFVYFPPFGQFEIPVKYIASNNYVGTWVDIDFRTGNALLSVYSSDLPISYYQSQIGVNVPLSATSVSADVTNSQIAIAGASALLGNLEYSTTSTYSGASEAILPFPGQLQYYNDPNGTTFTPSPETIRRLTGFNIGGAVEDFVSGFLTSATRMQTIGGYASAISYDNDPVAVAEYTLLVDDDNERNGRPLAKRVKLSTLSGYTTCQNPHLALPITTAENDAINAYLANGIRIDTEAAG